MQISEDSKTGLRIAMPRPGKKHLVEEWNLYGVGQDKLPEWFGKRAEYPQHCISTALNKTRLKVGVEYPAYALRHAWAINSIKAKTNVRLAAASLGHTVRIHESTYLHWITKQEMINQMLIEAT